jgi:hypothetical protein
MPIRQRWRGLSVSATCWIKALRSGWRTPVAILSWHTSQLRNADRMTTAPHTYPAMDSYRTLSCTITRSDIDSTNRITCDISRHIHHLSCRDANEITRRSSAHLQAACSNTEPSYSFQDTSGPPASAFRSTNPPSKTKTSAATMCMARCGSPKCKLATQSVSGSSSASDCPAGALRRLCAERLTSAVPHFH